MGRWLAVVLSSVLLASCSGGSSSVLPKAAPATPAKAKVTVSITMHVPGALSTRNAKLKRIFTIAQNTAGAQVAVYTAGSDTGTPLATTTANIEPSTSPGSTCTASDAYGNRSCSFSIAAPVGSDDFIITTYDQAPASGTIPAGANELGWGIDPAVSIVAGASATVNTTLSSVLASVSLDLTPTSLHQLIPTTGTIGVYALDADSDVIVSSGFVDPNGNPVTLSFGVDNSLNGALYFSPGSITAPSPTGVQYVYAPGNGVLSTTGNLTSNISVSCSSTCTTTGSALQAIYPTFTSIDDPNLNTNNPHHGGMVVDSSNNVCYTVPNQFGGISCYYFGTLPIYNTLATPINPILGSIVNAGPGQFYAIAGNEEQQFNSTAQIVPGPNSNLAPVPNGGALVYQSSTGSALYTSGSQLVAYGVGAGGISTYITLGPNVAAGVALDPSQNLWVVDNVNDQIFEIISGSISGQFPLQAGGAPWDVLANGNGIYVTDHGPNPAIIQLNSSGNIVNVVSVPGGATPWYLMADNAQPGIVWFDYLQNGQIGIGRMDTNVSPPTFVMAGDVNGPFGSQAGAIGAASNGLVYMVFEGTSTLVQVSR